MTPGTMPGPHEVIAPLGVGGRGQVYGARLALAIRLGLEDVLAGR